MTLLPHNATYIDKFIQDGQQAVLSLRNFYDTILTRDIHRDDHIIRIPIEDTFLKYRGQLEESIQYSTVPPELFFQPKTFSLELYETTEMWLSLMRVNGMRNITEFNQPEIRIYNPAVVKELIGIFFKREGKIT